MLYLLVVEMEKIVKIPNGINVDVEGFKISVSGPKGKLERDFSSPLFKREIKIHKFADSVKITTESEKKKIKAEIGCIASHIKNMIKGVTQGFTYKLKIVYVHFPMTVKVSGNGVIISNFLGERSPRKALIVGDTRVEVKDDEIIVTGIDLEKVSQTAANLERATWIKARDRRVYMDGLFTVSRE